MVASDDGPPAHPIIKQMLSDLDACIDSDQQSVIVPALLDFLKGMIATVGLVAVACDSVIKEAQGVKECGKGVLNEEVKHTNEMREAIDGLYRHTEELDALERMCFLPWHLKLDILSNFVHIARWDRMEFSLVFI